MARVFVESLLRALQLLFIACFAYGNHGNWSVQMNTSLTIKSYGETPPTNVTLSTVSNAKGGGVKSEESESTEETTSPTERDASPIHAEFGVDSGQIGKPMTLEEPEVKFGCSLANGSVVSEAACANMTSGAGLILSNDTEPDTLRNQTGITNESTGALSHDKIHLELIAKQNEKGSFSNGSHSKIESNLSSARESVRPNFGSKIDHSKTANLEKETFTERAARLDSDVMHYNSSLLHMLQNTDEQHVYNQTIHATQINATASDLDVRLNVDKINQSLETHPTLNSESAPLPHWRDIAVSKAMQNEQTNPNIETAALGRNYQIVTTVAFQDKTNTQPSSELSPHIPANETDNVLSDPVLHISFTEEPTMPEATMPSVTYTVLNDARNHQRAKQGSTIETHTPLSKGTTQRSLFTMFNSHRGDKNPSNPEYIFAQPGKGSRHSDKPGLAAHYGPHRVYPPHAIHGLIWEEKQYMLSVLVPIACGIAGALLIVCVAYAIRTCPGEKRRPVPQSAHLEEVTPTIDQIMLLADSSDDDSN